MAAGSGARMGSPTPKQFLELGGKPILRLSIEKIVSAVPDAVIVTVLPKEYIPYWKEYCIKANFHQTQIIVEGGITRFHSVQNALKKVPDGVVVAIHDGVRPLVSAELIRRMKERMEGEQALVPVIPSVDTLKSLRKSAEDKFERLPVEIDRECVYAVQTPQMFVSDKIKEAYGQAYDILFTDDSSVAEKKNIPLSYIEGERNNIKITTESDLQLAKAILALSKRR